MNALGNRLEGYDATMYDHQIRDLINLGYLVDVQCYAPMKLETSNIKVSSTGDYDALEANEAVNTSIRVESVVRLWKEMAQDRKTVIFAQSIEHAENITRELKKSSLESGVIHSGMKDGEIDDVHSDFKTNKIKIIVNVMMLTTGWDCPSVSCIVFARPTKIVRLYLQMIGRGLRMFEGKKDLLILDMSNVIMDNGYPTIRRNFDSVKKGKKERDKEREELSNGIVECPYCQFVFDISDVTKTVVEKEYVSKTIYNCPSCGEAIDTKIGIKKEIEALNLVEDPYQDTENVHPEIVESWNELEEQLAKAKSKDGKKYHHKWKKRVVSTLQEEGFELDEVKQVIEKYVNRGWAIGGIVNTMRGKR